MQALPSVLGLSGIPGISGRASSVATEEMPLPVGPRQHPTEAYHNLGYARNCRQGGLQLPGDALAFRQNVTRSPMSL